MTLPLLLAEVATDSPFEMLTKLLAPLVAAIVIEILRRVWKEKAKERIQAVSYAIHLAYAVTNEIARKTSNGVDDKVAVALRVLDKSLEAQGLRPATEQERQLARLSFDARHGEEKSARALFPSAPVPQ
jgi:hypothetical protein